MLTGPKILNRTISASAAQRETSAIPGGFSTRPPTGGSSLPKLVPVSELLGISLPPRPLCDELVDVYFQTVHWFSLVLYEPKFRPRYVSLMDSGMARSTDRPFLLLILMVLVMGCWYSPGTLPAEAVSMGDLVNMRNDFLKTVRASFMDLIDEDCLEFVQICTLLGSYWLYWGRPRSSFSMLGSAIKTSQALGLHRACDRTSPPDDAEERKRVWWTVYTWDRSDALYGILISEFLTDCLLGLQPSSTDGRWASTTKIAT